MDFWKSIFKKILLLNLLIHGIAYANEVQLLYNSNLSYHNEFVKSLSDHTKNVRDRIHFKKIPLDKIDEVDESKLLVTVGHEAASHFRNSKGVVLHVFNSRQSIEELYKDRQANNHHSIVLDQPIDRFFKLIRVVLGNNKNVDFMVSSTEKNRLYQKSAKSYNVNLIPNVITSENEITKKIQFIIKNSESVLLVPDPMIVNQKTARAIIVTGYKEQTPIIAYSRSLVKAGALMAVYTEQEQVVGQTIEVLLKIISGKKVKQIIEPNDFSVAVNYQLARAFSLSIQSEDNIKTQIENYKK